MAPAVPPPPVITKEDALLILQKSAALYLETSRRPSGLISGLKELMFDSPEMQGRKFSGATFVRWIQNQKELFQAFQKKHDFTAKEYKDKSEEEKNVMFAVKIGQALLEHRLAHHVSDDFDFENDESRVYTFIQHESPAVKEKHAVLQYYVDNASKFHQGTMNVRSVSFFGAERWLNAYGVLDDAKTNPRMLRLFKRQSAASDPFATYALEDCTCSMVECQDCKTGWYCFTLKARKGKSTKMMEVTLCMDHSKKQEGWLEALMNAGIEFEKEDEGDDLKKVSSLFELSARALNSKEIIALNRYKGNVCLVVNVACF